MEVTDQQAEEQMKSPSITEGTEELADVWLEPEVGEPPVSPLQQSSFSEDDVKSPLERLLRSISSDDQWTVNEGKDQESRTSSKNPIPKMYHDPTGEPVQTSEQKEEDIQSDHDSTDEVHTSPVKSTAENADELGISFSAVTLFRFLFGKKQNSKKADEILSTEDRQYEPENTEEYHETTVDRNINDNTIGDIGLDEDAKAFQKTSDNAEMAVNLPIFIFSKFATKTLKKLRNLSRKSSKCPLCGQNVSGDENLQNRLKLWRISGTNQTCEIASPAPRGSYKTELRINNDGTTSVTETFLRMTS